MSLQLITLDTLNLLSPEQLDELYQSINEIDTEDVMLYIALADGELLIIESTPDTRDQIERTTSKFISVAYHIENIMFTWTPWKTIRNCVFYNMVCRQANRTPIYPYTLSFFHPDIQTKIKNFLYNAPMEAHRDGMDVEFTFHLLTNSTHMTLLTDPIFLISKTVKELTEWFLMDALYQDLPHPLPLSLYPYLQKEFENVIHSECSFAIHAAKRNN